MLNDTLANALCITLNAEKARKDVVEIRPTSKMIEKVLTILNEQGYVGGHEKEVVIGGQKIVLNLLGKINKCGAIKPRLSIKFADIGKFEKRYLPADGFGVLIISTPQGIITNEEARKKKIGGTLLAYCY